MKPPKVPGAVDKIAEWRRAGELLRAELVATRDRLARELEEAENALCELDGRPVAIEKHLKREPKAPTVIAAAPKPAGKRGGGGIQRNGKTGWRWTIAIDGEKFTGKTVRTEDEARAGLEEFKRSRGAAPVPTPIAPPKVEPSPFGSSPWLPLGPGWGAPDENGLAKHLACNGKGCEDCKRQGLGRAKLRARAA